MRGIEKAKLPRRFHQPTFVMYNGQTDPVEHVSQFKQKMTVHSQDEALICGVFPSNLGPMPMRWFDGLKTNSISSFKKLTQSFCSRFITCSRVPLQGLWLQCQLTKPKSLYIKKKEKTKKQKAQNKQKKRKRKRKKGLTKPKHCCRYSACTVQTH